MDRLNKAVGFALALSFVAVACAAPAIPAGDLEEGDESDVVAPKKPVKTPPKKDNNTPADPTDPAPADPAPGDPTPTPTPTPAPTSCSSTQSYDACFDCCDAPSGGALAKADEAFGQCACGGGGQCASACGASFCNGQQPSAACDTCLTNTCEPAADALCTSAACKTGVQCLQTSNCEQKP